MVILLISVSFDIGGTGISNLPRKIKFEGCGKTNDRLGLLDHQNRFSNFREHRSFRKKLVSAAPLGLKCGTHMTFSP
jgi:hypothetical protein